MPNDAKTNERLTKTVRLNNLTASIQNPLVNTVYYRDTEADKVLRETLRIDSNDSSIQIVQKLLIFYLGCDKLSTEIEEHLIVSKAIEEKNTERIIVEVKLKDAIRYYKDKQGKMQQTGYRDFRIPNLSLDYVNSNPQFFPDMYLKIGSQKIIYTLTDGHQIKINAFDLAEGHRLVNYILQGIEPSKKFGASERHSYVGKPPDDSGKSPLYGQTVRCYKVVYVDAITGKSTGAKLY